MVVAGTVAVVLGHVARSSVLKHCSYQTVTLVPRNVGVVAISHSGDVSLVGFGIAT